MARFMDCGYTVFDLDSIVRVDVVESEEKVLIHLTGGSHPLLFAGDEMEPMRAFLMKQLHTFATLYKGEPLIEVNAERAGVHVEGPPDAIAPPTPPAADLLAYAECEEAYELFKTAHKKSQEQAHDNLLATLKRYGWPYNSLQGMQSFLRKLRADALTKAKAEPDAATAWRPRRPAPRDHHRPTG